ncbi:uncharacterized protein MONBRDRAFT_1946, partial [Monosiga brevicollis MX1]
THQAYVTLCTNDAYVVGAMLLAHSLRRTGTRRQIVCMITEQVADFQKDRLQDVFDRVFTVEELDSQDPFHLGLLQRPELGVTLTKLHAWKLTHYDNCVFLDADTLVLTNIDELFERNCFAAAPDIGWPDCFNSGVFVFQPSSAKFEDLVRLLASTGSFDGGDQGLLNEYFADWATQGGEARLPFAYNMTANASYGYAPAFERFKADIKVIHFIGARKPWMGMPDP